MGMDTIDVQVPLPDGPPPGECRTGSLARQPGGDRYRLGQDGRLYRSLCRWEMDDEAGPDGARMRRIDLGEEPFPFLGVVEIHPHSGGIYSAAFVFGRLVGIRAGDEDVWLRDLDGLTSIPWDDFFASPGIDFPERDQPPPEAARTLDALLADMTTPEEQREAEDRWRARVVSEAGGDSSTLTLVAQVHAPWIGMGDDGRLDVVEDAAGRRWLLLHDWGELAVVDPGTLDTLSVRLAGQMAELDELKLMGGAE